MGNVRTNSLKTVLNKIKKSNLLIIVAAVLVLMLVFASFTAEKGDITPEKAIDLYNKQYCISLEEKLETVVYAVNGIEKCVAMVTLKGGVEYIYASDNQQSHTSGDKESMEEKSNVTVLSDKQQGEKAVVIKELYPEINGVALVCKGNNSPSVILAVKNAAATALGISTDKVCVIIE